MKFLHTSDWHLGKQLHDVSLLPDQGHILDQILQHLLSGDYQALVIAGDIFDRSIPPAEATSLFSDFLHRLNSNLPDLHILIVAGNHDSAERLSFAAEILARHNIHLYTRLEGLQTPVRIGHQGITADFWLMPFVYPSALASHHQSEDTPEISSHEAIQHLLGSLKLEKKKGHYNVLAGHLFTNSGLGSDSERKMGTADLIDPALLATFDYTALGHLHRPQQIEPYNIFYSGSPLKYSFSEADHQKALLEICLDGQGVSVKKIPLKPQRDLSIITGDFQQILEGDYSRQAQDFLQIELTNSTPVINAMARLKGKFPNLLSVQLTSRLAGHQSSDNRSQIQQSQSPHDHFRLFFRYVANREPDQIETGLFAAALLKVEQRDNEIA